MAVVVSISRGHDASYPFRTIGSTDGATLTGERGAGCYLSAVEKGGEPAGTWIGNGAAELGFHDGDTVRRDDFEPLYGQFLDPRDPTKSTYLGSPPRVNAELSATYQATLAARPGATADERLRLLAEPARSTRAAPEPARPPRTSAPGSSEDARSRRGQRYWPLACRLTSPPRFAGGSS